MELKEGYKQIKIGIVPKDWNLNRLNLMSSFITKGATPTTYGYNWEKNGITFLRSECVSETGLDLSESMYISKRAHKALGRSEIKSKDILITITGNVGRVIRLDKHFGIGNINQHIARVRITSEKVDSNFVFHVLSQKGFRKYFNSIITGQAYPQISLTQVRDAEIPLPPTKTEQTAIATALSDTDSLIEGLEKLIAKKQNIKKGAMQRLLTPKEGWEVKKLGEIGDIITGSTPSTQIDDFWNGSIPWITPTDIDHRKDVSDSERKITEAGLNAIRQLPTNSLLVTCIASIGKNAVLRLRGASNQQINSIIPNRDNNVDFLYYLMELNKGFFLSRAGITATLIISKNDFAEISFSVPKRKEQIKIATILSDMDNELTALETKLEKYKMIKQGMMQNLLTGTIRLV